MTTLWDLERKPRLLVVQNDIDVGNLLEVYFTGLEAEVTVSTGGSEAIALASRQMFDLVLLDIYLPDISGYDVLRSIRASGNRVPVFFLTQRNQQSDKLKGLELGADDYITMPFDIEELLFRLKIALRHRSDYLKSAAKNEG